jgi:hypothetical protein
MKKFLLSATMIAAFFTAQSQVVVMGVSPAAIQGSYDYGTQANCGQWPGETDDGTWGVWSGGLDFNNPGDFVQAELMLIEDGTPGTNPQGNPMSQEGCSPAQNNLTGKIAVIYRNTCDFATKAWNAQVAGAVAVLIVNREDALVGMTAAVGGDGINVTIPAAFVTNITGNALIAEMANGPVTLFMGNKLGAFPNDAGAVKGEFLISPFGAAHIDAFDGFDLGIQVYNYGSNDQPVVNITASIDGATSGNVYSETITTAINSGDTAIIFNGNTLEFTPFVFGANVADDYTLTYTIDLDGTTDDSDFDNVYTADFTVQSNIISLATLDGSGDPYANSFPANADTEYESCMVFRHANASAIGVQGLYFAGYTDTSVNQYEGQEIFVNAYQWDDAFVDLDDPNFDFTPDMATNTAYLNLNLIASKDYFPASDNEVRQNTYVAFDTPFILQDNVRYMFCAQTYSSTEVSFGYDSALDYGANYSIIRQPISPVKIVDAGTTSWYSAGWNGSSASSIAINTFPAAELGLIETEMLEGTAYPNPATGIVTVAVNANGAANLTVTDVAGRTAINSAITLVNGKTTVDMASLEAGVYIFNVTMENGETSQFNVVKK